MEKIIRSIDLNSGVVPLKELDNEITVTAQAAGLDESNQSESVTFTAGALSYELDETNTYAICTGIGDFTQEKVEISKWYSGKLVREIGENAFYNCNLRSVKIPETVLHVRERAFYQCIRLETVEFEGNSQLETIGARSFDTCNMLTSINIPANVQSIGEGAFEGCTNLRNIIFDCLKSPTVYLCNSLKWTNISCYYTKKSTNTPVWPGTPMKFIGTIDATGSPLAGSLPTHDVYAIALPQNVDSIAFIGYDSEGNPCQTEEIKQNIKEGACWEISATTNLSGSVYYMPIASRLKPARPFVIGKSAFLEVLWLTSLIIPDAVTSIGEWAFAGCRDLETVEIGCGAKEIGAHAFQYCENLKSVLFGKTEQSSNDNGEVTYKIKYSDALKTIGENAFTGCNISNGLVIPTSVVWISKNAFAEAFSPNAGIIPVTFNKKYGWFYTEASEAKDGTAFNPENIGNTTAACGYLWSTHKQYNWYRITQVPAPDVVIDQGHILKITDHTGLAEEFRIFVDEVHRATMDVRSKVVSEVLPEGFV